MVWRVLPRPCHVTNDDTSNDEMRREETVEQVEVVKSCHDNQIRVL